MAFGRKKEVEPGVEEQLIRTLENFNWATLFDENQQAGLFSQLLPWLSFILLVVILIMQIRG